MSPQLNVQPVVGRGFAVAIHLGATLLIAGFAATLVFGVWYPYPYRSISGGLELFALVVGVDLVIGPMLTAVVFNPAKTEEPSDVFFGNVGGPCSMNTAQPATRLREQACRATGQADHDGVRVRGGHHAIPKTRPIPSVATGYATVVATADSGL